MILSEPTIRWSNGHYCIAHTDGSATIVAPDGSRRHHRSQGAAFSADVKRRMQQGDPWSGAALLWSAAGIGIGMSSTLWGFAFIGASILAVAAYIIQKIRRPLTPIQHQHQDNIENALTLVHFMHQQGKRVTSAGFRREHGADVVRMLVCEYGSFENACHAAGVPGPKRRR